MTKQKETGGPAFPWTADRADRGDVPGMTLRDYFAAKAMQGICAGLKSGDNVEHLPTFAYLMADAMLKARND